MQLHIKFAILELKKKKRKEDSRQHTVWVNDGNVSKNQNKHLYINWESIMTRNFFFFLDLVTKFNQRWKECAFSDFTGIHKNTYLNWLWIHKNLRYLNWSLIKCVSLAQRHNNTQYNNDQCSNQKTINYYVNNQIYLAFNSLVISHCFSHSLSLSFSFSLFFTLLCFSCLWFWYFGDLNIYLIILCAERFFFGRFHSINL